MKTIKVDNGAITKEIEESKLQEHLDKGFKEVQKEKPKKQVESGQFFENIEEINLKMLPDDYIAYVFTSTGAGELELGQSWKEMF